MEVFIRKLDVTSCQRRNERGFHSEAYYNIFSWKKLWRFSYGSFKYLLREEMLEVSVQKLKVVGIFSRKK